MRGCRVGVNQTPASHHCKSYLCVCYEFHNEQGWMQDFGEGRGGEGPI